VTLQAPIRAGAFFVGGGFGLTFDVNGCWNTLFHYRLILLAAALVWRSGCASGGGTLCSVTIFSPAYGLLFPAHPQQAINARNNQPQSQLREKMPEAAETGKAVRAKIPEPETGKAVREKIPELETGSPTECRST